MATYNTIELYNKICEILNDGYEYVDISESEGNDDLLPSLCFEAIDEFENTDYKEVESCSIPDDYDYDKPTFTATPDSFCHDLHFTYNELSTIHHAVCNALAYFKECLKDPSNSREVRDEIKESSIQCRNLQAKLNQFFKRVH